ncbi:hypothetical protein GCM10023063_16040 [Arthrobacter methylotrophus]|uniref:Uncharacterized protein n=1 Tax=Arthrobacter methylotrophus TaxID=121291 RepID=A0ABV5UND2_9MICC
MFLTYLLQVYGYWLFASTMFIWLGSALYRTIRNTLNAGFEDAVEVAAPPRPRTVRVPARPTRKPGIHQQQLTTAA